MPVDSAGNATRPPSPIPVSGQDADAPQVNVPIDDIYSILNLMTFLDGRKSLRGNIPMNGYRAVGAADAVDDQDYVTLAQLQAALSGIVGVPTGMMSPLSGTTIPQGWVRANGQTLSRSAYPALWAFAQTSENLASSEEAKTAGQYGPGNGTTTFTLPNLEADGGYFIRPVTSGRGIGTVQQDDFKSHQHEGTTAPAGAHSHAIQASGSSVSGGTQGTGSGPSYSIPTSTAPDHTHSFATNAKGGTETRPKNIAYPIIIKA